MGGLFAHTYIYIHTHTHTHSPSEINVRQELFKRLYSFRDMQCVKINDPLVIDPLVGRVAGSEDGEGYVCV